MTNTSRASLAGLMYMAGGLLFTFYFIGINPLLRLFDSPFEPSAVAALKMLIHIVTSLCLAGGSIGILALGVTGTGWKRATSLAGTAISLLGLTSYIVGSIYIYNFPERAFRQFFTPGGSILLKISMTNNPMELKKQLSLLRGRNPILLIKSLVILAVVCSAAQIGSPLSRAQSEGIATSIGHRKDGKRLFECETFGGNGRTCLTCHSRETGTVAPEDAQERFRRHPKDPLFLHDGSDDRQGNGVYRMLKDATILVEVPLPENVSLADDPTARSVILARGIPSTLNTPALDPVLMLDGRQPDLIRQALGAIHDHFQNTEEPDEKDLRRIAEFQLTSGFFSSHELRRFASGGPAPTLPPGRTESEKRGRRFFEDVPINPVTKAGSCAACHGGPMLNQTNQFLPLPVKPGSRFQNVLVSEFNAAGNRVREFIFKNPDGTTTLVKSPDPGRALITGDALSPAFDSVNAFKIPSLWGVRDTAPYFHDNSAKTLEDVVRHYDLFFATIFRIPTNGKPPFFLTEQEQADIVAYLRLLD